MSVYARPIQQNEIWAMQIHRLSYTWSDPKFLLHSQAYYYHSSHANRVLVIYYRHIETSISGAYYAHILVNLKSASKQKHHQKFVGGIFGLHKNALTRTPKLVQAIAK